MNRSNNRISIDGPKRKGRIPAWFGAGLAVILLFNTARRAEAIIVTMQVPVAGTQTSYIQDFSVLNTLDGTLLNGQSYSLNVFFDDNNFLVAAGYTSFTMDLFVNQSGAIGAWPADGCCVTGYLIDAAGNPLSSAVSFPDSGSVPAQVWPGWPFYLSDGTEYIPPTKMFEAQFSGVNIYGNPGGYYINPIIFSGVHFDIKYSVSPTNEVIGGRIVIANFIDLLQSSPIPVPVYSEYFIGVPSPALTLTGPPSPGGIGNTNAFCLQLSGTPDYPYILQSATNLAYPNWQSVITNSADSNGNWNIAITNSPKVPSAFFRVVAWPGPAQQ
jgi:hypothetical protein